VVTELVFEIRNVAKQSVRGSRSHWYQTARVKNFEKSIILMARQQLPALFEPFKELPLWVEIVYRYKTKSRTKEVYRTKTPDIDSNINKGIVDALKGILWEDDRYISRMSVMKLDSFVDTITVRVGVLDELS